MVYISAESGAAFRVKISEHNRMYAWGMWLCCYLLMRWKYDVEFGSYSTSVACLNSRLNPPQNCPTDSQCTILLP